MPNLEGHIFTVSHAHILQSFMWRMSSSFLFCFFFFFSFKEIYSWCLNCSIISSQLRLADEAKSATKNLEASLPQLAKHSHNKVMWCTLSISATWKLHDAILWGLHGDRITTSIFCKWYCHQKLRDDNSPLTCTKAWCGKNFTLTLMGLKWILFSFFFPACPHFS